MELCSGRAEREALEIDGTVIDDYKLQGPPGAYPGREVPNLTGVPHFFLASLDLPTYNLLSDVDILIVTH